MIYAMMSSLGEMATYLPITGSINAYGTRFFDPALGFMLGKFKRNKPFPPSVELKKKYQAFSPRFFCSFVSFSLRLGLLVLMVRYPRYRTCCLLSYYFVLDLQRPVSWLGLGRGLHRRLDRPEPHVRQGLR